MSAVLRPHEDPPYRPDEVTGAGEDEGYPSELRGQPRNWLALVIIVAFLGGLAYLGYRAAHSKSQGPRQQVVKIAVLPDTPPPPPPPKEEKKPEDKQDNKPQPQDKPKPLETPPAPQQLKMDGPAGEGPSPFAAGTVNNEYRGGEIGTGNGLQFALFTNQLQRHMQEALARDPDVKSEDYKVDVSVWLRPDGSFDRVRLDSSTGNAKLDASLRQALNQLPPVTGVPANLPQPVRLRITNRMMG